MGIQTSFSIKDLESLSQIKAHTIRIWEKRYKLFNPTRSNTNIRSYSNSDLQKLLNISLLNQYGYKISVIANKGNEEIREIILKNLPEDKEYNSYYNNFKIAMVEFDKLLFEQTYNELLAIESFETIYIKIFYRLLTEIGLLWQTNTLSPAQEHFISTLIYQKLLIQIDSFNLNNVNAQITYILFLPENEIHQIGLLFIQYLLLKKNQKVIFLGPSISIDNLVTLKDKFNEVAFVTNISTHPHSIQFFIDFKKLILNNKNSKLHVFGLKAKQYNHNVSDDKIKFYESPFDFIEYI